MDNVTFHNIAEARVFLGKDWINASDQRIICVLADATKLPAAEVAAKLNYQGPTMCEPNNAVAARDTGATALHRVTEHAVSGAILGAGLALAISAAVLIRYLSRRAVPFAGRAVVSARAKVADAMRDAAASSSASEAAWAEALREFEAGEQRQGVWAQALGEAMGNDAKAKAIYLALRARQLSDAPGSRPA